MARSRRLRATLLAILSTVPLACSAPPDDDDDGFNASSGTTSGANSGATTTSVGTGGSGTSTATTGPPPVPFPCVAGRQGDDPSGNSQVCASGLRHRQANQTCPSSVPRADINADPAFLVVGGCSSDAECSQYSNGFCGFTRTGYYCDYGCVNDGDCGEGNICDCGSFIGKCVPATCKTDADCGDYLCAAYDASPGCGVTSFACQSAQDECGGDADCAAGSVCSSVGGVRRCVPISCN